MKDSRLRWRYEECSPRLSLPRLLSSRTRCRRYTLRCAVSLKKNEQVSFPRRSQAFSSPGGVSFSSKPVPSPILLRLASCWCIKPVHPISDDPGKGCPETYKEDLCSEHASMA